MATSNVDTVTDVIGRIPILDVQPAVDCGRRPAKSVAGETFPVSATVFREGHGAVAAAVVLRDPDGSNLPMEMMQALAPGTDRWGAWVTAPREGDWSFRIEAWSDPIADWHHDAGIKVPRGQDIELVMAEGALLFVGDCHATQGDGELSGVAVEQRATVTLQVDLIKNWAFAWPRLETADFIMTIGSARPLEDAARIAYRELVRWMSADYGFDEIDAYMLLSQAGRIRLGNMVDPKYTMGASILKKYLVP